MKGKLTIASCGLGEISLTSKIKEVVMNVVEK